MRHRKLQHTSFEWLCACLILSPCAVLAQQSGPAPKSAAAPADSAAQSAPAGSDASAAAPSVAPSDAPSNAPARGAPAKGADDLEPAVDTSDDAARARAEGSHDAKQGQSGAKQGQSGAKQAQSGRGSGKAIDHLELGTTDITGNRELPKVMYIVPWKRSDLGDLTGKPLNSLVDQALQPVDRNEFERSNRYYGAVTADGSTAGPSSAGAPGVGAPNVTAPNTGAPKPAASQDVHRTPGAVSGSAVRDER